jgi:hypothetical protein
MVKGPDIPLENTEVSSAFLIKDKYGSNRIRNRKDLKRYHEEIAGLIIELIVQSYKNAKQVGLARVEHESTGDGLEQDRINMIRFANAFVEPAHETIRSGVPGRFVHRKGARWIEYTILPLKNNEEKVGGQACNIAM